VDAACALVRRLSDLGHRRVAYLRPDDDQEPTRDREAGFRAGAADAGLPGQEVHVLPVGSAPPADRAGELLTEPLTTLLETWRARDVTAVLVDPGENDRTVAVLEQAAARTGVRIPEDLSVAVLGDPSPPRSAEGSAGLPASSRDWTRFALPREALGRAAVHLLLDLLADDGGGVRQLLVPCTPVDGDTVGSPR
jgi:DNA-binding LacI/PurR family transcriptional regulator